MAGPHPPGPFVPLEAVPGALSAIELAALWFAFLATVGVAGSGWVASFVRTDLPVTLALSPAFGLAAIILGGVIADRAGLRPTGWRGVLLIGLVSVAGWVAFVLLRTRRRPTREP